MLNMTIYNATFAQAKADLEALIREKEREGYVFTRFTKPRSTGLGGMGAYVAEVTFVPEDAE